MADLQGEARRRYVADLFSRIAGRYDLMNTVMTADGHHRWRKLAAKIATEGQHGPALDVATGTGDLAIALARLQSVDKVVGMDLLPQMVTLAQSKARSKRLDHKVEFSVGDGLSLPFPDGTFACVTSGWGIRNMPDVRRSLEEMVRVVKPGGRVVSLDTFQTETGPLRPMFRLWFHHIVPFMGQVIARDRAAYTYLPRSVDKFLTVSALSELFSDVGLQDMRYRRMGLGAVVIHWGTKPLA